MFKFCQLCQVIILFIIPLPLWNLQLRELPFNFLVLCLICTLLIQEYFFWIHLSAACISLISEFNYGIIQSITTISLRGNYPGWYLLLHVPMQLPGTVLWLWYIIVQILPTSACIHVIPRYVTCIFMKSPKIHTCIGKYYALYTCIIHRCVFLLSKLHYCLSTPMPRVDFYMLDFL